MEGFRPFFSVVMLAKDKSKFLYQAALSVLSFPDSELIIVEPGSADESRTIAEQIKSQFNSRVKLMTDVDYSAPEGLNHGLTMVSGKIIGFLNADDEYLSGGLQRVKSYFQSNARLDLYLGSGLIHNLETDRLSYHFSNRVTPYRFALSALGGYSMFQPGIFYRFESFPTFTFNQENRSCWDAEMLAFFLSQNPCLEFDSYPISIFRIYNDSITGSEKFRNKELQWLHQNFLNLMGRDYKPYDYFNSFILRIQKRVLAVREILRFMIR